MGVGLGSAANPATTARGEALMVPHPASEHVIRLFLDMTLGGSQTFDPPNSDSDASGGLHGAPGSLKVARGLAQGALSGAEPAILAVALARPLAPVLATAPTSGRSAPARLTVAVGGLKEARGQA